MNQGLYLFLVQHFLKGSCLLKMVRKALLKSNQEFKGAFDSVEGWAFDRGPISDAGNEAVSAEILVEDSRSVFRGQVGQDDIY